MEFYSELYKVELKLPKNLKVENLSSVKELSPGKPSLESGKVQLEVLKRAVEAGKRGEIDGIITLPINKKVIREVGFNFPGHTEFLADAFKVKDYGMMLSNGKLRVVLLTTHIPLREVPKFVKKEELLRKLRLIGRELPGLKVAVCGLNPHAGEEGLFGREEVEEIAPAVRKARKEGLRVSGPYPSDTLFKRALEGDFDLVLALYHDQGLIPIKLLGFGKGVNITLGLPIIRTSVDHGTAYDIAGKGVADSGSFKEAVREAIKLFKIKKSAKI